jgi:hypothetical protein
MDIRNIISSKTTIPTTLNHYNLRTIDKFAVQLRTFSWAVFGYLKHNLSIAICFLFLFGAFLQGHWYWQSLALNILT